MSFHMRRKDKEITDPELLKRILKTSTHVTLALSMENRPYLVSLSHGYDEPRNCLYFHCAPEGKKLNYLRSNNAVWGQAMLDYGYIQEKCTHLYASVHFSGRVTLIENLQEKRQAVECMINQLDNNPEKLIANLNIDRLKNTIIGRIDIDYVSGKKSEEIETPLPLPRIVF
jgi:nitroimidazol reductase NimA-like FMN-containing flavoprotein (pyridoxamine 5'-phosphate oxidase superfamily)